VFFFKYAFAYADTGHLKVKHFIPDSQIAGPFMNLMVDFSCFPVHR